mmetsp:Transcript_11248/g.35886  ORF Transcript_11248/g.35886 Transcript_11248/m.35886 type:complete len:655 (+) Transcript_11248:38-2002(+)
MSSESKYSVPSEMVRDFTPQEITEFRRCFRAFDEDGNGSIDRHEMVKVLNSLGENLSSAEVDTLIASVDIDKSGTIEFNEFLLVVKGMRHGAGKRSSTRFERVVKKSTALFEVKGKGGTQHSFSDTEKRSFTEHINNTLKGDTQLAMLPLDPDSMDLFTSVRDGVLLCKLINKAVPETIDERALNLPGARDLNIYQINENLNLALNAAKSIGCVVVNIGTNDMVNGMKTPHLVLGLVWQIVKIQLLSAINLKQHPELVRLLNEDEGEELADLLKLPPEHILLRWINFHLKNANHPRRVTNFTSDLADSEAYTVLLSQIAPDVCDQRAMAESDMLERARHVIRNAKALEVPCFIQPEDIVSGNPRMNLAFLAQIFNQCPGLSITEEEAYEMVGLLDDDEGDSREERVFRMWINSLNAKDLYIHNLFEDLRDGVALLQLMDAVQPGIVSWRRVNRMPKNKFKKVENANYVVVLGKQMGLHLVNVGGVDIVDGNKKLILAVVWQLMRRYIIGLLESLSEDRKRIDDAAIVKWANARVRNRGRTTTMDSFRDKSLATGQFLMDLLWSLEPRAINWELVTPGETADDRANNAKYIISVARKFGAAVFLTWEDIVEVKPKMIMSFVASLWATSKVMQRTAAAGAGAGAGAEETTVEEEAK